eukprot:scaffold116202_cov50-Phaeocystis_antarctica.AAC.2
MGIDTLYTWGESAGMCAQRGACFCVLYKAVKYHYQAGGEEGAIFFYPLATGSLCRLHNPLYALVHYPTGAAALQRGAAKRVERRPGSGRADCLWLGAPSRLCRVYTAALWAPEQSHTAAYVPQRSAVEPLPRRRQTCRFHRRL